MYQSSNNLKTQIIDAIKEKKKITLTAAWCWENVCSGVVLVRGLPGWAFQMFRRLSLPPLARNFPSGDHFNPHTSWV